MSRSFGSEIPNRPHLVVNGKGGLAGEIGDLRSDVNDGFTALEAELDAKNFRDPVRLATAAALPACTAAGTGVGKTLTANANGALTVDGVTPLVVGDRVLVKDQVAGANNGIYIVTAPGTAGTPWVLTRATDADSNDQVMSGLAVYVSEGTANTTSTWVLTTVNPITLDTTALVFTVYPVGVHGPDHIRGAVDEVDGDQLDIDMTPTHYTPDAGVPEAGNADHLAAHLGGIDNEIGTLKARTGHPTLHAIRVAGGSMAANGSENFTLLGDDFLQGQTFASLTLGASLAITAEEPGVAGNALTVEVVDSGGGGLAVTYAAGAMEIDLGGAAPTEDNIASAINIAAQTWTGILRATSGGGGAVAVTPVANLAGGVGAGISAYAGGAECAWVGQAAGIVDSDATASVQDTVLYVNCPDLTAVAVPVLAAADTAAVWVESSGVVSSPVSVLLA